LVKININMQPYTLIGAGGAIGTPLEDGIKETIAFFKLRKNV